MSKSQKISVVMPLFNHAKYLERTFESLLNQVDDNFELVIVDDGSSDSSAKKALRDISKFQKRIFLATKNQGAHAAINLGISVASGDWISILNSDDEFLPNRISTVRENMSSCEVLATDFLLVDENSKAQRKWEAIDWKARAWKMFSVTEDLKASLVHENFLATTSNLSFSKGIWRELGGFANLRYCHDIDFMLRSTLKTEPLILEGISTLRYRQHSSNTISEDFHKVQSELKMVLANFFFEENSGQVELGSFLSSRPNYLQSLRLRSLIGEVEQLYELRLLQDSREKFFDLMKSLETSG
jgi:glycosyltransferase involved in cell wall biosynthesis